MVSVTSPERRFNSTEIAAIAVFSVLTLACFPQAAAQGMHKCKDAAGKITYAGRACVDLGLHPAGEITERSSVAPATAARPEPAPAPVPAAEGASPAVQGAAAPAADAGNPERRCFKTAKGYRCNDIPEKN